MLFLIRKDVTQLTGKEFPFFVCVLVCQKIANKNLCILKMKTLQKLCGEKKDGESDGKMKDLLIKYPHLIKKKSPLPVLGDRFIFPPFPAFLYLYCQTVQYQHDVSLVFSL